MAVGPLSAVVGMALASNRQLAAIEESLARLDAPGSLCEATVDSVDIKHSTIVIVSDGSRVALPVAGVDLTHASADAVGESLCAGTRLWLEVTDAGAWAFRTDEPASSAEAVNFELMGLEGAVPLVTVDRYHDVTHAIVDAVTSPGGSS